MKGTLIIIGADEAVKHTPEVVKLPPWQMAAILLGGLASLATLIETMRRWRRK